MKLFLICLTAGMAAQLVDGTLGMAYGVTSGTLLRAMGIPSAVSSFCVHLAEIFTTLASGVSHFKMKNIDKGLVLRLIIPGVVGGVVGAYILTSFDERVISPIVSAYLIVMGIVIFVKAVGKSEKKARVYGKEVYPIALVGGLSDSIGGGGWGPVVTVNPCSIRLRREKNHRLGEHSGIFRYRRGVCYVCDDDRLCWGISSGCPRTSRGRCDYLSRRGVFVQKAAAETFHGIYRSCHSSHKHIQACLRADLKKEKVCRFHIDVISAGHCLCYTALDFFPASEFVEVYLA